MSAVTASLPSDALDTLLKLLNEWREPALVAVRSCDVVPDATNREYTQLSVEHVHFIAHCIQMQGFRARKPGSPDGHDVPVVVRARRGDAQGEAALSAWHARSADRQSGFPRCEVSADLPAGVDFFCSLGNGHFNQALNLYRQECMSILAYGTSWRVPAHDEALRSAIRDGVPSVVLRIGTPRAVRMQISLLLNQTHRLKWDAEPATGRVYALPAPQVEAKMTQFEALSKVLDAEMLSDLLRTKLKAHEQPRPKL